MHSVCFYNIFLFYFVQIMSSSIPSTVPAVKEDRDVY